MITLSKKLGCLHRPCDKCGERFKPTGKDNRLCNKCRKKAHIGRKKKHKQI